MLTSQQLQMFESIARDHPKFRLWLEDELTKKYEVLVKVIDGEQMRRAQGHAQCLQTLIEQLDYHKSPSRR